MAKRQETEHPNIFLYPKGIYYFRGSMNGTQIERSLQTDDFRVAKKRAMSLINTFATDDFVPGNITAGSLYPKYIEKKEDELADAEITDRYFKDVKYYWTKYLKTSFEAARMRDLASQKRGPEMWRAFKKKYRHMDMSNMRKIFRGFLFWAQKEGHLIWVMPCDIPNRESRKGKALTADQRESLVKACKARPGLLLFVLMYLLMALRRGEIINLMWDQINFFEDWLLTKKYRSKTKPARVVPLHPVVKRLLLERKESSTSAFVFPQKLNPKKPMFVDSFSKPWTKALKDAGLTHVGLQMHDLRRTWETEAQTHGEFTDIQREKFAGHSAKVAKDRYAKFSADHLRPLVNAVEIKGLEDLTSDHENTRGNLGEGDSDGSKKPV